MTRTERAAYPRALNRDRSESRTGLDPSLRKGGAGNHNWGSLADEQRLEASARDDEEYELTEEEQEGNPGAALEARRLQTATEPSEVSSNPPMERSASVSSATSSVLTEEDMEKARKLRKNAFKSKKNDQLDLAAIARSSVAVSTPSPDSDIARRPGSDNRQVTI